MLGFWLVVLFHFGTIYMNRLVFHVANIFTGGAWS